MLRKENEDNRLNELSDFYNELDKAIGRIEKYHKDKMNCSKGCKDCCIDGITVFEIEAFYIKYFNKTLKYVIPASKEGCCFRDENNECIIYETRPYVCRTQGLPLRWIDDSGNEAVEMRDICPLNEKQIIVESLPQQQVWQIGPFESKLAALQYKYGKGKMKRVELKTLFKGS